MLVHSIAEKRVQGVENGFPKFEASEDRRNAAQIPQTAGQVEQMIRPLPQKLARSRSLGLGPKEFRVHSVHAEL